MNPLPTPRSTSLASNSLAGARIWLSAAVPEPDLATPEERAAVQDFVRLFARQVFERGGYVVHGSHPSLTAILLEEARRHREKSGRRDLLILAVSRLGPRTLRPFPSRFGARTPSCMKPRRFQGPNPGTPASSCSADGWLRGSMRLLSSADGGGSQSVIVQDPKEVELATKRGIPTFLLGGLGGAAKDFILGQPETLRRLKNGLDVAANAALSTQTRLPNISSLPSATNWSGFPLVRGRGSEGPTFRILALDGGGLRGAFTASVLATWEKSLA